MGERNEYPSNSDKSKALAAGTDRRVEQVVTGPVKVRKRSEAKKLADIFISEDAGNVKNYIFMDVLIPAVKKAISDIVTNGIDMILYGETGRSKRSSNVSRASYRDYSSRPGDRRDYRAESMPYDYDEIILPNRGKAQEVLDTLEEIIAKYDVARVADFYELVGITPRHTDNKYGWADISMARVIAVRDGYLIKLPRAAPLD
ncbi:hypothetical protein CE91St42_14060 [Oscillospiraceae bacterium]|nr:hypothetical protein CE91St42_14060 [Oscillospiraceae bacterium]